MSIMNMFGIPFYHAKVDKHEQLKEKFLPYFDKDEYFDLPSTWLSPCKTTIHSEQAFKDIPFNDWLKEIVTDHFIPYIMNLNPIDEKNLNVEPLHVWMNKYSHNEGQEPHNHIDGSTQFSCAYVLEQPEDSCEFLFIDKNDYFSAIGLAPYFYFNSPVKNFQVDLQEGDIVIFPSFVEHAVSRNRSHEVRKTMSANFRLNYRQANYSLNLK